MLNESIQNNYKVSYDDWYSERRIVTDAIYQVDIGSAQSVKSLNYLICSHQRAMRLNLPNKIVNTTFFEHLDLRKFLLRQTAIEIHVIAF